VGMIQAYEAIEKPDVLQPTAIVGLEQVGA
jgi:hypothetical protein